VNNEENALQSLSLSLSLSLSSQTLFPPFPAQWTSAFAYDFATFVHERGSRRVIYKSHLRWIDTQWRNIAASTSHSSCWELRKHARWTCAEVPHNAIASSADWTMTSRHKFLRGQRHTILSFAFHLHFSACCHSLRIKKYCS